RYSIGTTAGDWNQDGFADLVVTSIGASTLLINNGDGTFTSRLLYQSDQHAILPSSAAIADVTGDSLPDIVEVLYVADPEMLVRPDLDENGDVLVVAPASFVPAKDRVYVNDGQGGFLQREISEDRDSASTGLGVVITDFDGKPGNEMFIGNDIRANHYWVRDDQGGWTNLASLMGCAFGNGGITTASMGIATADFDGSGTPDIHITNFFLEPVSFYINRGGSFEDRAVQFRLATDSRSVLGFGTQAIDVNNNGHSDLVVTNGHIEKPANPEEPFHQPPQLFLNTGRRFQLTQPADPSGYWKSLNLGRGLAKVDFDRDGKEDMVVTHIGAPSALVLNRTETKNHWLDVKLVGTTAERDAIGAHLRVHAGQRVHLHYT
ncbi:MAG: VCBS repeat-containing protein, partial [Pirellulales bacterium]|nr:VCBS repeat-containing protein [Pirellulales bacterium]